MFPTSDISKDETVRAAWLYYVGNLSQQEVSDRLGISRFKVLRLLADAREQGAVRISVEHRTTRTLEMGDELAARFGLQEARVAPVPDQSLGDAFSREAVGILGAAYLANIAGTKEKRTIGVGWGRTLSLIADALTGVSNPNLTFASIMGSVAHASHTAPGDVCIRLAAQTKGRAVLMPAPFVADTPDACAQIMQQRLVREAVNIASTADHAIMSVGECNEGAILFDSAIFSEEQLAELKNSNVAGDCCGVFFMDDGSVADIELNRCTPSVKANELLNTDVAIACGGRSKARAMLAVLRAGFAKRVFVDELLAENLLERA